MDEREVWIQKYIQQQIGGMTFGSEVERQHMIQQARQSAEAYLQTYQRQSQGNPGPTQKIDPYSDEGRQMWERETGDTVHNPGTQQRYLEWAKSMKEGGGGSRGNALPPVAERLFMAALQEKIGQLYQKGHPDAETLLGDFSASRTVEEKKRTDRWVDVALTGQRVYTDDGRPLLQ